MLLENGECDWGREGLEKCICNLVRVVDILKICVFKCKVLYNSVSIYM
jgi:hypothetical protein